MPGKTDEAEAEKRIEAEASMRPQRNAGENLWIEQAETIGDELQ